MYQPVDSVDKEDGITLSVARDAIGKNKDIIIGIEIKNKAKM